MKKGKILITAAYLLSEIDFYRKELEEKGFQVDTYPVEERLEEEELLKIIADYQGVICGDDKFTSRVFDEAKELKVVVKWGTGIDSIDKKYAESKGIQVRNTPNAFSEPVSDSILAFILAFARSVIHSDRIMKAGGWKKTFGVTLEEVSIGIIGVGNIGKALARKIKPFGTKVYGNDIVAIQGASSLGIEMVSLDELLTKSDFVTICCDLNATSHHLMNVETINRMKQGSHLINTARGPIVDEEALITALQSGHLGGAGLDVFEDEPLPIDSPLRCMDQVLLSSHNVNASPKRWERVHRNSLNMLYESLGI